MEPAEDQQERAELNDIIQRLKKDGFDPGATADERLRHLWRLYLRCEGSLLSVTKDLEMLRSQQDAEMKEVESYVEHIRNLSEERETLTAEYERDNEQLRIDLQQLRLEREAQMKEVEEMLDQEGLADIAHSSPSEQIAYLLVERATLLEKLENAEGKLDSQSYTGSVREVHLQEELDQIRQTLEEELRQQRESMQRTKETMNKDLQAPSQSPWKKLFGVHRAAQSTHAGAPTYDDELSSERRLRERLERDLDEAARRLSMAHEEIRRLTDELDILRKAHQNDPEVLKAQQEADRLREEVKKLKDADLLELEKAKDHNQRLDKENLALRNRVRSLDSQRKMLQETVEQLRNDQQAESCETDILLSQAISGLQSPHQMAPSDCHVQNNALELKLPEEIHARCQQDIIDKNCRIEEANRKLQKLQFEHEELVERNEELESILGETQNKIKDEKEHFESEVEGMQRKISDLEAEISRLRKKLQEPNGSSDLCKHCVKQENVRNETRGTYCPPEELICAAAGPQLKAPLPKQPDEERRRVQQNLTTESSTVVQDLKRELQKLEEERSAMRAVLSETQAQLAELQKRLSKDAEEKRHLATELHITKQQLECRKEGSLLESGLDCEESGSSSQLLALRLEMGCLQSTLEEERLLASQHQLALQAQISEAQSRSKSQDSLLQQRGEEVKQLRHDLNRVQTLFTSAERELRYEREKSLDLKKHIALLEQEKTRMTAELKKLQTRLVEQEQANVSLNADLERRHQKVMELELTAVRRSESNQTQQSLQEELISERKRLAVTEKKVQELQQQLKGVQHQLRLAETRTLELERMEAESRTAADSLASYRSRLQDEQLQRKLLEQKIEELQLQVQTLREKENTLTYTNSELSHKLQQQGARLSILEDEHSLTTDEHQQSRKANQKLYEQLVCCQQESEKLQEELQQVMQQLDSHIRKYNEKQTRHKSKLRRAKQVFLKEVAERDVKIKELEDKMDVAASLSEKEQEWIQRLNEENEKLLHEKRELLRQLSEEEELGQTSVRNVCTVQRRVNFLEEENRQLYDRTLQLSSQVGALERALRSIQSFCGTEELKKALTGEGIIVNGGLLQAPSLSFPTGSLNVLDILEVIRKVKAMELPECQQTPFSSPRSQPSDIGYLNVTPAGACARTPEPTESLSTGNEGV
ncbi:coiled-coil domain-containing protein 30 isoform X2 [Polypterus senegalus]|uniref:coiled-coil domain-containing protein 30 isoform X2 n=1 Tax=Polypterus senegalus TaxID=55291 RepID=UPI00196622A8|nr:coiled-coil domain-containing protein 30 isoform X2 [Polypterus senegalus]